jgi:hypothetical protein
LKEVIRVWSHFIFAFGSFIINCSAEKYNFPELAAGETVHYPVYLKNKSFPTYSFPFLADCTRII